MAARTRLFRLVAALADPALADSILGDLEEQRRHRASRSRARAWAWFWVTAAALLWHLGRARVSDLIGSVGGQLRLTGLAQEARRSMRSLRRTPAVSGLIVLTLALGFGLNTAIFSVVYGVLFDQLPFDRPHEIVMVAGARRGDPPSVFGTSYPDYRDLRAAQTAFRDLAVGTYWTFTVTGTDVPLRLVGQRVSGSFFPVLGMTPALGRWIGPPDDVPGGAEVVVLSHGLWQRVFGGDAAVLQRTIELNGVSARIIGVMPPAFRFPFDDVELWTPALDELDTIPRNSRFLTTFGRVKPGIATRDAEAELLRLADALEAQYPETNTGWRPALQPAVPALTASARPKLLLLLGAVLVVLAIAAINVTALLMARASARRREFVVRESLGAGRLDLLRVPLLESAWLGAFGLVFGCLLAMPAVAWLRRLAPPTLPRLSNVQLNFEVLAYAAAAMLVAVVASAFAPSAWRRRDRAADLRSAGVALPTRGIGRRLLVVGQVAGAVVLLAATGLLVRSFARILSVEPGFDPDRLAMVRVFLTPPTYRTIDAQIDYVGRALDVLRAAPGVVGAAAISQPPFDAGSSGTTLAAAVEGRTYAAGSHPVVAYRAIDPAYFATLGIRILDGRALTLDDRRGGPRVVVINRAMATRFWPGARAVGRRFEFADGRNAGWHTVVGVVGDVATNGLEQEDDPAVYAPIAQRTLPFLRWMTLVVRTEGDPDAQIAEVRARLQAVDARQPLYGVSTMRARIAASLAERRFALALLLAFAGLALGLVALGIYGALAQRVAERRREIGVRVALGASPSQIGGLVAREAGALVAAGAGLGLLLMNVALPYVRGSLFGVSPTDAWTYVGLAIVLALTTASAAALPSRAAARTDPVRVLKND
jgi:predicted permease